VAERAVKSAGVGVSMLIPDQTSVMIMVGDVPGDVPIGAEELAVAG
jgi:hypothetical protein